MRCLPAIVVENIQLRYFILYILGPIILNYISDSEMYCGMCLAMTLVLSGHGLYYNYFLSYILYYNYFLSYILMI